LFLLPYVSFWGSDDRIEETKKNRLLLTINKKKISSYLKS